MTKIGAGPATVAFHTVLATPERGGAATLGTRTAGKDAAGDLEFLKFAPRPDVLQSKTVRNTSHGIKGGSTDDKHKDWSE